MADLTENPQSDAVQARLRALPSVERLASSVGEVPHAAAIAAAREELDELRERIRDGEPVDPDPAVLREVVAERARMLARGSLRPVINATGVILHTNLGRAPLAPEAAEAAARIGAAYSNLELDLEDGERGSRQVHVEGLLRTMSGAEAALAVNNNAAAVLLALAALAGGREVVIGRNQLVEIGGSFRIPEILAQSGASLVEVGTTNRTRVDDYEDAIGPETATIMRVHQSNFRTVGFVEEASLTELRELADAHGLALIDDLGSGAIEPIGDEPTVRASVEAGADLVCWSADKLLGGPQAGILTGRSTAVEVCRAHPLARALRLDKLQVAALETTLRLYRDEGPGSIPAIAMLRADESQLAERAQRMADAIGPAAGVIRSTSRAGGGSLPLMELEGPACAVEPPSGGAAALAGALRRGEPPVVARVEDGRVILDPRTISDAEADAAAAAVRQHLA
ncbi:MAG: L-seryl-tRNA(Sec) selenium transferase [Solirubrobacterales bacterium]